MNCCSDSFEKEDRSGKRRSRSVERYFLFVGKPPTAAVTDGDSGGTGRPRIARGVRERERFSL